MRRSSFRPPQRKTLPCVQALAERFSPLYAALGLHPIVIEQHTEEHLERLRQALEQRPAKVVAVGEIGLDRYRDDPQFAKQERFLQAQLTLAKRFDLPVILHSRRTHDTLAMHLKRHDLPRTGVVHGFARAACNRPNALYNWDTKSASVAR